MAPKPSDCREHAKRCVEMAAETTDVDIEDKPLNDGSEMGAPRVRFSSGQRPRGDMGST